MFNRKFLGAGAGETPSANIVYNSNYFNSTHTSKTFTFPGANIGAADPSRVVLISAACARGAPVGNIGITVNGVAATLVVHSGIPTVSLALFRINLATGTTATIVLQANDAGNPTDASIGVFSMYNASSSVPFNTNTTSATSLNINVPANGVLIATARGSFATSYTGITQRYSSNPASFVYNSGASDDGLPAQTGKTITELGAYRIAVASFA